MSDLVKACKEAPSASSMLGAWARDIKQKIFAKDAETKSRKDPPTGHMLLTFRSIKCCPNFVPLRSRDSIICY